MQPIKLLVLLCALLPWSLTGAESDEGRAQAPYFEVPGSDPKVEAMPLKSTEVTVKIAGVIADVRVVQCYSNVGSVPLEAIYVFPGSTRSAVYALEMKVGERVLKAQIQPREQARKTYEAAKTESKSAALLEQHRPNVFQMNVAHILPGDNIMVELHYTELLVPTAGEYSFVYPTVVGPRYAGGANADGTAKEGWVENPYLKTGTATPSSFKLEVDLSAGMPLQGVRCATHPVKPEFRAPDHAVVALDVSQGPANNRDFILSYRLADAQIQSGLLLAKGDNENFFLLTVQPPKRIVAKELPARDYTFVVDVSGSMAGFPLATSKTLIKELLASLNPNDSFNVLLFAGDSSLLAPQSLAATPENIQRALSIIDNQSGRGATELLPALKQALRLPGAGNAARSIVVITDGFVNIETAAFDLVRENLNHSNVFAFGIGSSVNRFLIEGLAHAGQGEPFVVTRPEEAEAQARKFREYISAPILTHITADYKGFEAYDIEPRAIPDMLAERPVVIFGKWKGALGGTITVRGKTGAGEYEQSFETASAKMLESSSALGYLWARGRIQTLADYIRLEASDERVKEVTSLGLTYHLLTEYTSFVAVDQVVRAVPDADGKLQTVVQALPVPQGVEQSAVGGSGAPISTTPEPEAWILLCVLALVVAIELRRQSRAARNA